MAGDTPELSFLGYQRAYPKQAMDSVLADALARFIEKYARPADVCLLSVGDAQTVGAVEGIEMLPRTYMQDGTLYVARKESVQ